jgi:hypothetical protein
MSHPHGPTRVTLVCASCGRTARRDLLFISGCRGVHETAAERALCPCGAGPMGRADGFDEHWAEPWKPRRLNDT